MTKIRFLFILLLFTLPIIINAQTEKNYIIPSVYYTHGAYTEDKSSTSISAYSLFTIDQFDYIIAGYDNLVIHDPLFNYNQNSIVLGGMKNLFPFILTGSIFYSNGKYDYKPETFLYEDDTFVLNFGGKYNVDLLYLLFDYSFAATSGFINYNTHQISGGLDYYLSPQFSLHGKIIYSHPIKNGRLNSISLTNPTVNKDLLSGNLRFNFIPNSDLLFSIEAFIGSRLSYFNPTSLTIFSQYEVQNNLYLARAEWQVSKLIRFIASYQYTEFEGFDDLATRDYALRYLSFGTKFYFEN